MREGQLEKAVVLPGHQFEEDRQVGPFTVPVTVKVYSSLSLVAVLPHNRIRRNEGSFAILTATLLIFNRNPDIAQDILAGEEFSLGLSVLHKLSGLFKYVRLEHIVGFHAQSNNDPVFNG